MRAQSPSGQGQGSDDVDGGVAAADPPDQALLRRTASAPGPGGTGLAAQIAGVFMAGMHEAMVRQQVRAAISQQQSYGFLRVPPAAPRLHSPECLDMVRAPSVTSTFQKLKGHVSSPCTARMSASEVHRGPARSACGARRIKQEQGRRCDSPCR